MNIDVYMYLHIFCLWNLFTFQSNTKCYNLIWAYIRYIFLTYHSHKFWYNTYIDNCLDGMTEHPFLLFCFFLFSVPRVEIVDERGLRTPDKFYKAGSTIELKCVISKIPQPTSYVTWKHGLRMLNYDTSRGGIRYIIITLFNLTLVQTL